MYFFVCLCLFNLQGNNLLLRKGPKFWNSIIAIIMVTWQGTMHVNHCQKILYSSFLILWASHIAVDVNVSLNNLECLEDLDYNTAILKSHEDTTHTECTYTRIPFRQHLLFPNLHSYQLINLYPLDLLTKDQKEPKRRS